ncbi:MAG TPA: hemerythrin family protein [Azonexus sp.]|nr:hemerythrin family protein [Azonexus sp.]
MIDIPEIDDQHARLFEQLEVFKASCLEHNAVPLDEAEALFTALLEHCRTEERLAREAGLDFRRHAEKHATMLHSIRKVLDDMERPGVNVFGVIRYIGCWFERHIREEDKRLGLYLRQVPCVSPGQRIVEGFPERPTTC